MIDYNAVAPRHTEVNQRLNDWARWVRDKPAGANVSPMFRMYRSKRQYDTEPHIPVPLITEECLEVERAVSGTPEPYRTALRWYYVWPWVPNNKVRQHLGMTRQGLFDLITSGRDMVQNRMKRGV